MVKMRHSGRANRIKSQAWLGWIALLIMLSSVVVGCRFAQAEQVLPPRSPRVVSLQTVAQPLAFLPPPPRLVEPKSDALILLGEALFWDPILSGNKDIACATCHHPLHGTGDDRALSIGEGGVGLGPGRYFSAEMTPRLIPRNAPAVFNVGFVEMETMFWDGRVSGNPSRGFETPAAAALPDGLDNALAAQALFPVTSRDEMRGHRGDYDILGAPNEIAVLNDADLVGIWAAYMARLLAIPGYQQLFTAAYPQTAIPDFSIVHVGNALAAYQQATFTFLTSPWDRYIQGDLSALSGEAQEGAELFFGVAGCAECHNGPLLSDMRFYNIGVPQIGPGKGGGAPLDIGRAMETGLSADRFAFRTPPLRNVALTGPWMHNGAYGTLEQAVRHHLDAETAVSAFENRVNSANDASTVPDPDVLNAALHAPSFVQLDIDISDRDVEMLLAFLHALSAPEATDLSATIPDSVPSGLPVGGIGDPADE